MARDSLISSTRVKIYDRASDTRDGIRSEKMGFKHECHWISHQIPNPVDSLATPSDPGSVTASGTCSVAPTQLNFLVSERVVK